MLVRRMSLPTRVMRGSSFILNSTSASPPSETSRCRISSASTTMERNLSMVNGLPPRPMRSCRNSTGPPSVALTAIATAINSGEMAIRPSPDATTSNARLANALPSERRGVERWMSGRPARGCVWRRGPATSTRAGAMIRETPRSCSSQPSRRTSEGTNGWPEVITTASTSRSSTWATTSSTVSRSVETGIGR